ncbi:MAG: error-prone DNA polymerase, partial [Actinobacteria bacterium]|nr:error-prone DNA polymerase [Actinomycetota bacterium]
AHAGRAKDDPRLDFDMLAAQADGLIALSACAQGELQRAWLTGGEAAATAVAGRYADTFGPEGYYVELHNHLRPEDARRNTALGRVARLAGVPLVATNNVHYAAADRALLHHVVTCIRRRTTLDAAGNLLRPNDEHRLKSPAEMAALFAAVPAALANTQAIAAQCTFHLRDLRYEFPTPALPPGASADGALVQALEAGIRAYYGATTPALRERIDHELDIVRRLDLQGYLLVFKDIVDFCRRERILVSIRGSAPASVLLYCLGLCPIDPFEHDLLFERFASPERRELPDIDLDIEHEQRERVIQYVYATYGRERAAMVAEVNTFRLKSAVRDVAKALGLPAQQAQQLALGLDRWDAAELDTQLTDPARLDAPIGGPLAAQIIALARQLEGAPRHLSIHVGGFVISARPLDEVVPQEPARMEGRTIIPWDKYDLEVLAEEFGVNLIKLDLLGLGMLTLIGKAFAQLQARGEAAYRLHGFRYDPQVYDLLCRADTMGLFQVESRAQMSYLPRLKPRDLHDTAVSVGAIRPGPGAARAGDHIARRRAGLEPVTYPHPSLEPVLKQTLGVLLWQEQVMQVAMLCGGYTPGEADQLRRAMSNKRSTETMQAAVGDLKDRMLARGFAAQLAELIQAMVFGFAGYGFPRAHAYAFAHLALVSATLKLRHPAVFYAALLNSQPMGFYAPHTILWDAYRHQVDVRPVDVNRSAWDCLVEDGALRLGFRLVEGFGAASAEVLERARTRGPYRSVADFLRRTGLNRDQVERLAEVGAFAAFADRRNAAWLAGELAGLSGPPYLPGLAEQIAEPAGLPPMTLWEAVGADYAAMGYSPERHLLQAFRPKLDALGAKRLEDLPALPHRSRVAVGGLVVCRQRPETAGGHVFLTLEDETGLLNVIVRPKIFEAQRRTIRGEPLLLITGALSHEQNATSLLGDDFEALEQSLAATSVAARNFH